MYFFSWFLADTTSGVSALFEPLKSRWWAPLGITMATTESDWDFSTPPEDQGSKRPLLEKKGQLIFNVSYTITYSIDISKLKVPATVSWCILYISNPYKYIISVFSWYQWKKLRRLHGWSKYYPSYARI